MDKQPCYNLKELARHNLHIHTKYSLCAKPEMTIDNIIRCAEQHDIKTVAITDHYNNKDFQVLKHNEYLKDQVNKLNTDIKVLFGAELSAYGIGKFLDPLIVNKKLDYRLYAYNHFHLKYWDHPQDTSPRGYVEYQLRILTALFQSGRADCIAHPFIGRFIRTDDIYIHDNTIVTKEIKENELGDIMLLGRECNVAWEINSGAVLGDPNFAKRYWNIGKEVGVKFNFGTDAHRLDQIDSISKAQQVSKILTS